MPTNFPGSADSFANVFPGGNTLRSTASLVSDIGDAVEAVESYLLSGGPIQGVGSFLQSGTGAVQRTALAKMRETVTPADFGAVGDGVTNDTATINLTLARNVVSFPAGTFLVSPFSIPSGTRVYGAGRDRTTIKLVTGANTHLLSLTSRSGIELSDLTLDAGVTGLAAGHGMRMAGVTDSRFLRLRVKDAGDYGIGIQDGTNGNLLFDDVEVDGAGLDGFDIKDINNNNTLITIRNFVARNIARKGGPSSCLDLRGPVNVDGVTSYLTNDNTIGFRFRTGGVNGRAASGRLRGARVVGDVTKVGTYPWIIEGSDNVGLNVSDCHADDCAVSAIINGVGCNYSDWSINRSTASDVLSVFGSNNNFTGIQTDGGVTRAVDIEPGANNNRWLNFAFRNITTGTAVLRVQGGCVGNSFLFGWFDVGDSVSNSGGASNSFRFIENFRSPGTQDYTAFTGTIARGPVDIATATASQVAAVVGAIVQDSLARGDVN